MARRRYRQHTQEFKLAALARMDCAPDIEALARELDIERALLYRWQRHYLRGGAAALRNSGRPRPVLLAPSEASLPAEQTAFVAKSPISLLAAQAEPASPVMLPASSPSSLAAHDASSAARRISELERKIGQQQLELDFFRAALRHVRDLGR